MTFIVQLINFTYVALFLTARRYILLIKEVRAIINSKINLITIAFKIYKIRDTLII
jgi:hypothetical protein